MLSRARSRRCLPGVTREVRSETNPHDRLPCTLLTAAPSLQMAPADPILTPPIPGSDCLGSYAFFEVQALRGKLEQECTAHFHVVVMTTISSGKELLSQQYRLVIVDEAGQSVAPSTLVALQRDLLPTLRHSWSSKIKTTE